MTAANTLRPLPGRKGVLIGVRESLAYLKNPDQFIAQRAAQFGPVFGTTLFFRPTAVVGGTEAVADFLKKERSISASSLPAAFTALHTNDGALNQQGARHRSTRAGYAPLFTSTAFEAFLPTLNRRITAFVDRVAEFGTTMIAFDCKRVCLDLYAEIFAGEPITEPEAEAFVTYNNALLSISKLTPSFRRGEVALADLQTSMLCRLARFRKGELNGSAFKLFTSNLDETGKPWSDQRIATATVLLIWGAFIEVASLMCGCLILCANQADVRKQILAEANQHNLHDRDWPGNVEAWSLPYAQGVLRESLRLMPPGGGGFRQTSADISIAGFRIPAGTVVTVDPRISNKWPSVFPEPERFAPDRWVSSSSITTSQCPVAGSALRLPKNAWFPGGTGNHGCPGIPLAELSVRIFLVRWMQAIQDWRQPEGAPAAVPYSLIPIRIPTDDYQLVIDPALPSD